MPFDINITKPNKDHFRNVGKVRMIFKFDCATRFIQFHFLSLVMRFND